MSWLCVLVQCWFVHWPGVLLVTALPTDDGASSSQGSLLHFGAEQRAHSHTHPAFLPLRPAAGFIAPHFGARRMIGTLPSMVPLPSALGYLGDFRHPIPADKRVCKMCHRYFSSDSEYQTHNKVCSKGMLACDFCDMAFARKFNLKVHLRCRHGVGEQLTCPHCGITFRSKVRLESHRCLASDRRK